MNTCTNQWKMWLNISLR